MQVKNIENIQLDNGFIKVYKIGYNYNVHTYIENEYEEYTDLNLQEKENIINELLVTNILN